MKIDPKGIYKMRDLAALDPLVFSYSRAFIYSEIWSGHLKVKATRGRNGKRTYYRFLGSDVIRYCTWRRKQLKGGGKP